jgi:hypothetical protein
LWWWFPLNHPNIGIANSSPLSKSIFPRKCFAPSLFQQVTFAMFIHGNDRTNKQTLTPRVKTHLNQISSLTSYIHTYNTNGKKNAPFSNYRSFENVQNFVKFYIHKNVVCTSNLENATQKNKLLFINDHFFDNFVIKHVCNKFPRLEQFEGLLALFFRWTFYVRTCVYLKWWLLRWSENHFWNNLIYLTFWNIEKWLKPFDICGIYWN